MRIYHGHPSEPSLAKCRDLAPSFEHGAEFSDKVGRRDYDNPYIVDNGAFAAFKNDEEWDSDEFVEMLEWTKDNIREPEWVVVPDVVGETQATYERSREWVDEIDHATYQPVQDGMDIDMAIDFTLETGSEGVFIGGSKEWKKRTAKDWIDIAHDNNLKAHVARPWDLLAAYRMGADSCDTTTVVAWGSWDKLRTLEAHTHEKADITTYV